jgi:hypothetical protein
MNAVDTYTKNFSQESWLVGRDLNSSSPPKHKSQATDWFLLGHADEIKTKKVNYVGECFKFYYHKVLNIAII